MQLTFKEDLPQGQYQGWANYQTWSVSLYIENDFGWYQLAKESKNYKEFAQSLANCGIFETPDGVAINDSNLSISELDKVVSEL